MFFSLQRQVGCHSEHATDFLALLLKDLHGLTCKIGSGSTTKQINSFCPRLLLWMGLRAKLSGPGMFRKSTGYPSTHGIFEGVETTKQFWLRQPVEALGQPTWQTCRNLNSAMHDHLSQCMDDRRTSQ